MYKVVMRENNQKASAKVFQDYIKLEKRYSKEAFENLAKAVGGDRGEIKRFFNLGKFYYDNFEFRTISRNGSAIIIFYSI